MHKARLWYNVLYVLLNYRRRAALTRRGTPSPTTSLPPSLPSSPPLWRPFFPHFIPLQLQRHPSLRLLPFSPPPLPSTTYLAPFIPPSPPSRLPRLRFPSQLQPSFSCIPHSTFASLPPFIPPSTTTTTPPPSPPLPLPFSHPSLFNLGFPSSCCPSLYNYNAPPLSSPSLLPGTTSRPSPLVLRRHSPPPPPLLSSSPTPPPSPLLPASPVTCRLSSRANQVAANPYPTHRYDPAFCVTAAIETDVSKRGDCGGSGGFAGVCRRRFCGGGGGS